MLIVKAVNKIMLKEAATKMPTPKDQINSVCSIRRSCISGWV